MYELYTYICQNCGITFQRTQRPYKNNPMKFCSKRCNVLGRYNTNQNGFRDKILRVLSANSRSEKNVGNRYGWYQKEILINHTCHGRPFEVKVYRHRSTGRFCKFPAVWWK